MFSKEHTLESLENDIEQARRGIAGQKVNHILHLLLCIPTVGLWIVVWILVWISSSLEISRLERKIKEYYSEKSKLVAKSNSHTPEGDDTASKLIKLAEMLEKGLITEDEFKEQKTKMSNA